jgi:hypothetical protein
MVLYPQRSLFSNSICRKLYRFVSFSFSSFPIVPDLESRHLSALDRLCHRFARTDLESLHIHSDGLSRQILTIFQTCLVADMGHCRHSRYPAFYHPVLQGLQVCSQDTQPMIPRGVSCQESYRTSAAAAVRVSCSSILSLDYRYAASTFGSEGHDRDYVWIAYLNYVESM